MRAFIEFWCRIVHMPFFFFYIRTFSILLVFFSKYFPLLPLHFNAYRRAPTSLRATLLLVPESAARGLG